jgi:hypothetical protein
VRGGGGEGGFWVTNYNVNTVSPARGGRHGFIFQ